jgi:hypothetical protein
VYSQKVAKFPDHQCDKMTKLKKKEKKENTGFGCCVGI